MTVFIDSPAKVNLHLEILNKREDGYHNLLSVVQLINIYDKITIQEAHTDSFSCNKSDIKDNIVLKALNLFRKRTGIKKRLKIKLIKEIPYGAGLGGGSGNAASVLIGLNLLFNAELSNNDLIEMSMKIGSDIPMFIGSPASIIKGRGEIIMPLKTRNDFEMLLVYPGFKISTVNAYNLWDKYGENEYTYKDLQIINMYEKEKIEKWRFYNSFAMVIENKYPEISKIKKNLMKNGALYAEISGSGSAVFGIFEKNSIKNRLIDKIKSNYSYVRKIKMLDRSIKPVLK